MLNIQNNTENEFYKDLYEKRQIRVFISSTFIDMQEERDELVKKVFPQLRKLCEQRGVGWSEVDLRWGVTDEEKADGKVLPICLEEINNCRPYFIGLLGERYGWVPESFSEDILKLFPWIKHSKDKSITEIEIYYGVLNNPEMALNSFFYFRNPDYLNNLPEATKRIYNDELSEEDIKMLGEEAEKNYLERKAKLGNLKKSIKDARLKVRENYNSPKELGKLILEDFTKLINDLYPNNVILDIYEEEEREQQIFVNKFTKFYIPNERYLNKINEFILKKYSCIAIKGNAGTGKTSLISKILQQFNSSFDLILYSFVGSTTQSADLEFMLKMYIFRINKFLEIISGKYDDRNNTLKFYEIKDTLSDLISTFNTAINELSNEYKIIIIIDSIDQMDNKYGAQNLIWLPEVLSDNIKVIISANEGASTYEADRRGWESLKIEPLLYEDRKIFIKKYLKDLYRKELSSTQLEKIAESSISSNPLSLTLLLEELRLYGNPLTLNQYIDYYVTSESAEILIDKILSRYEKDFNSEYSELVKMTFSLLCISRDGLSESELLDLLGDSDNNPLPSAIWSPLFLNINKLLINKSGRLNVFQSFVKNAIKIKYFEKDSDMISFRKLIITYFKNRPISQRKLLELPYQLMKTNQWKELCYYISIPIIFSRLYQYNKYELNEYWNNIEHNSQLDSKIVYSNFSSIFDYNYINEHFDKRDEVSINMLGDFFFGRKKYKEAIDLYKILAKYFQLKLLSSMDSINQYQSMMRKIENVLLEMGDYDNAMILNQHELNLVLAPNEYIGEYMNFHVGRYLDHISEKEDSIVKKLFSTIYKSFNNLYHKKTKLTTSIASAIMRNGELVSAKKNYKNALNTFRAITYLLYNNVYNTINFIAFVLKLSLSIITLLMYGMSLMKKYRDYTEGLRGFSKNFWRAISKGEVFKSQLAASYENQARVLYLLHKKHSSLKYYEKAENIYIELNDKINLCKNLEYQANINYELTNIDKSLTIYIKLENICRMNGFLDSLLNSLYQQLIINKSINPNKDFNIMEKEINSLKNMLEKYDKTNTKSEIYHGILPFISRRLKLLRNLDFINTFEKEGDYNSVQKTLAETIEACHSNVNNVETIKLNKDLNKVINKRTFKYDAQFYIWFGLFFTLILFSKVITSVVFNLEPYFQDKMLSLLLYLIIIYSSIRVAVTKTFVRGLQMGVLILLTVIAFTKLMNIEVPFVGQYKLGFLNSYMLFYLCIIIIWFVSYILRNVFKVKRFKININLADQNIPISPDFEILQKCNSIKAKMYLNNKDYLKALKLLLENLSTSKKTSDVNKELESIYQIIIFYLDDVSNTDKAHKYIQEYKRKSNEYCNESKLAEAFFLNGFAYNKSGNYELAITELGKSIDLYYMLGDINSYIYKSIYLVNILIKLDRYDESLEILKKCNKRNVDDDDLLKIKIYFKEYEVYFNKADYDSTYCLYDELIKLYTKYEEYQDLSCLYVYNAFCDLNTGKSTEKIFRNLELAAENNYNNISYIVNNFDSLKLINNDRFQILVEKIKNNSLTHN